MFNALRAPRPCLALVAILSACSGSTTHSNLVPDGTLTVDPATAEVGTSAPGNTAQFTARQGGAITTAVSWTATGGSISGSGLYTAPSSITGSSQQFVVTASSTADHTKTATATVTVTTSTPTAALPTFTPAAGTYASAQSVAIACSTTGSTIYYTTNGTTPTHASSVYSSPIAVSATTTIEAICAASGYTDSAVASAVFVIGATSGHWSTGYYVYYAQDKIPLTSMHWGNFTHLILHTGGLLKPLSPTPANWPDGDADNTGPYPVIGSQDLTDLDGRAGAAAMTYYATTLHSHGVAALMGLGSDAQHQFDAFDYNTSTAARRVAFADQIIAACNAWGFDGVDFDWEAPSAQGACQGFSGGCGGSGNLYTNFTAFLQELKSRRLAANHPTRPNQPVITTFPSAYATVGGLDSGYATWLGTAAPYLDQVFPMTYVATMYSGGSVVWHQAPLHGGDNSTAWDIDVTLNALHAAGVPKANLGIGLSGYGLNYHGSSTTAARIGGSINPFTVSTENSETIWARYGGGGNTAYFNANGTPVNGGTLVHDSAAGATYVWWNLPGLESWHCTLLSLDDAWAWQQKVNYVLAGGWGGIMVWALQDAAHPDGTTPELDTLSALKAQ